MRGEEAMFTKEMSGHLEPFNYHGSINLDVTDVPSYSDHSYSDILATVTKSLGPKWPFL